MPAPRAYMGALEHVELADVRRKHVLRMGVIHSETLPRRILRSLTTHLLT
jgi:hypothetical protein